VLCFLKSSQNTAKTFGLARVGTKKMLPDVENRDSKHILHTPYQQESMDQHPLSVTPHKTLKFRIAQGPAPAACADSGTFA
jgi:hypothetical protein